MIEICVSSVAPTWPYPIYFSVEIWRKSNSFLTERAHLSCSWHMNASVSEGMYENLVKCPQMAPKVDIPKLLFRRRSDLYFQLFLFLWFKLNSFKEVIYREESGEENGCSVAVFDVSLSVSLSVVEGVRWSEVAPKALIGKCQIPKKRADPDRVCLRYLLTYLLCTT